MKPIGVFGGTFDPIHYGHLRTAFEMLQALRFDEVRFMPCGKPPHRGESIAHAELRLEMVRVATNGQPGFIVDDREPVRLTDNLACAHPTWDPDGAGIACADRFGKIYLVTRGGDVQTLLTASDAALSLDGLSLRFSPHGSIIYFLAVDQDLTQGVWSIPATGGEPRLVVTVDDPSLLLFRTGVSVGAERLYFSVAEYESDIYVMDLQY